MKLLNLSNMTSDKANKLERNTARERQELPCPVAEGPELGFQCQLPWPALVPQDRHWQGTASEVIHGWPHSSAQAQG